MEVVRALDAAELEPSTLVVREPTLDDVFLSLTGRPAEEVVAEQEANDRPAEPVPAGGAR
jgi:hypothetical protein